MPIDFTTPIGQIRALINDTDEDNLEIQDDQMQAYLDMSYDEVALASIMALQALVSKYTATSGDEYRIDTIQYREGKSKASLYMSLLNNLEQSIKDGTTPMLIGVPKVYGVYRDDRKENLDRMADGEIIPPKTLDEEYTQIDNKPQYGPYYRG